MKSISWYIKAALNNDITNVITVWLRNAKNGVDSASANDDITHQMQGADNQILLVGAINTAVAIVSREQGGILTPSQQELIQILNSRTQDFQQVPDLFQMQPIDQGLEPQNGQQPSQENNGW